MKDYSLEADIRALGEALYMPGQANWQGKKEKFQAALSCIDLRYPYKARVKMVKT